MPDASIWFVLAAGAAVTYASRGLGVALSGRIDPRGALFQWVGCVAYALLAGLVARMILFPVGPMAATDLGSRLLATAVALAAFFGAGRSVVVGVTAGTLALIAFTVAGVKPFG